MPSILIIILLMCSVAEASEYSIATYNIWFDDPTSADRAPKILDTIHNENPDVVAFQEVERWFVNYLKRDDRFSNYNIAYKKTWNAGISGGLLILTKGKILEQEYINLPSDMGRGVLSIVTNIGGISTCVATSHLESMIDDTSIRIQQLKTIISTTSSCSDLVLLGDFNYGDGETENKVADLHFSDVWKILKVGSPGYTWDINRSKLAKENSFPLEGSRRLDRIYIKGKHLIPVDIKIIGDTPFQSTSGIFLFPSDHFGLSAKFAIQ